MKSGRATVVMTLLLLVTQRHALGQSVSLPAEASVRQVLLTNLGGIKINVATTDSSIYLFPSFGELKRIAYYQDESKFPTQLINSQGKIDSGFSSSSSKIAFEVQLDDLLASQRSQIVNALQNGADPSLRGRQIRQPDMLPECSALFEVRDEEAGGQFQAVGKPWEFTLDTGSFRQTLKFIIHPDDNENDSRIAELMSSATDQDLRLTTRCRYNARFTREDLRVTGKFLEEQVRGIAGSLSSSRNYSDILLFIPIGGDISSQTQVSSAFQRSMTLVLEKREGATAQDLPPEDLVNRFVDQTFKKFEEQVKLSDLEQSKVVSFILSNGIRVTLPLGKVNKLVDDFSLDTERKTSNLFSSLYSAKNSQTTSDGIDIDVLGFGGGGFSTSNAYTNATSSDRKQMRDTFGRDVQMMKRSVEGDLNTVTAMNISQLQRFASAGSFNTLLEANQFAEGQKDLIQRFSCNLLRLGMY